MARPTPGATPVFHLLPIEKLASVIDHGLLCDAEAAQRFGDSTVPSAAHDTLKRQRRDRTVPVARFGTMAEYVPFYFAPRSPMLYAIRGGQTRYDQHGRGQRGMLHLAFHLEALIDAFDDAWCFIDAHLTRSWARFGSTIEEPTLEEARTLLDRSGAHHRPDVHARPPGHYSDKPFPHGYYYH